MNTIQSKPIGFFRTVLLLLRIGFKRSQGRRRRQQELLNQKTKGQGHNWGALSSLLAIVITLALYGFIYASIEQAVETAQFVEAAHEGNVAVTPDLLRELRSYPPPNLEEPESKEFKRACELRASASAKFRVKAPTEYAFQLCNTLQSADYKRLVVASGMKGLRPESHFPSMIGSMLMMLCLLMMACQGEGVDLDIQRRRHPIWEWLFSHPVRPGAVFLAEMLLPISSNPMFWTAPFLTGLLYHSIYGVNIGLWAGIASGIPLSIAAACLGKALEIGILLRFSPRVRGALIGLLQWASSVLLLGFFFGPSLLPKLIFTTDKLLYPLTAIPWPWMNLVLGIHQDGSSYLSGIAACWAASAIIVGISVVFSVRGMKRGLSGSIGAASPRNAQNNRLLQFGTNPLYKKELLWFKRDLSALVQAILIPLTIAGYQLFNLRNAVAIAGHSWNYLSGAAIFFGTYFLWVLGPKSLQSEGAALWITLTWPLGLETLLKTKAKLWAALSTILVFLILSYAIFAFPRESWKILLVAAGWYVFSRSMAEKSVTLVTITSESGEVQKIPKGRFWATQLGMLTFAIGIGTQQWQLAIIGIVYSYMTAAAMWQNFRARLPYLYDPWSEEMPKPPTLMHAMIAISVLVEATAALSIPLLVLMGKQNLGMAQTLSYGILSIVVSLFVSNFLKQREVQPADIWLWSPDSTPIEEEASWLRRYGIGELQDISKLLMGVAGGLALGIFAHGYQFLLHLIPRTNEILRHSEQLIANMPNYRLWYAIMAVGFAPFAEEYLFRGLLYRALDSEWGGWTAILASAAFFAIYHPPLSWIPVFLLGAANAWLFKKTGRLAPAVLLHMTYNAIVLM